MLSDPVVKFVVNVGVINGEWPAQMAQRTRDFGRPLADIAADWRAHNVEKFEQAKGGEMGVSFDGGAVLWDAITPEYQARKRVMAAEHGWPGAEDWRMVLTGEAMASLTDPGSEFYFERNEPDYAVFGSTSPHVTENFHRSPAAFLDEVDRQRIPSRIFDWMQGHPPYLFSEPQIAVDALAGGL